MSLPLALKVPLLVCSMVSSLPVTPRMVKMKSSIGTPPVSSTNALPAALIRLLILAGLVNIPPSVAFLAIALISCCWFCCRS